MRKISWILFFSLLILLTACGNRTTPTQKVVNPTTSTSAPSATLTLLPEPTHTSTPSSAASPTTEPTATQAPTEVPPPTATPTEEPAQVQPIPTPTEPGSSTADAGSVTSDNPPDNSCTNKAAFFDDVTIPDDTVFRQSETFIKTWRVRNEGTCTWNGYKLVSAGGEAMNAMPSIDLESVIPGAITDISVDMQAPKRGGSHTSFWQFATDSGETFGVGAGADGLLWVRIKVDYSNQDQTSTNPGPSSSTTSSSSTSSTTAGCTNETNPGYVSTILDLVNGARSRAGLKTLVLEDRLSAAAQQHSLDMACNDFISHTGSDGSLWYQRVADQGYANSNSARENIYVGNPAFGGDAQGAFDWWMNSQIHRDNILNSGVTQIGIAYVYVTGSSYGGYYTLIVARP